MKDKIKITQWLAWAYWLFMIVVSVAGGLNLGDEDRFPGVKYNMPDETAMIFCMFFFAMGIINGIYLSRRMDKPSWIDKQLDRIFGVGFSDELMRKVHAPILFPAFFILTGSIGLMKAEITGVYNFATSFFLDIVCLGIGLSLGFFIHWLFWRRKKIA